MVSPDTSTVAVALREPDGLQPRRGRPALRVYPTPPRPDPQIPTLLEGLATKRTQKYLTAFKHSAESQSG